MLAISGTTRNSQRGLATNSRDASFEWVDSTSFGWADGAFGPGDRKIFAVPLLRKWSFLKCFECYFLWPLNCHIAKKQYNTRLG